MSSQSIESPNAPEATMSGADIVIQVLAEEGVNCVFGYSGGAILPTYDAIFRHNQKVDDSDSQIQLIVPANEQGAGFMAAGYSRASNRVGVCMVTSGPGATNTVTPVRDCLADSIPMVVITGQVPTHAMGSDAFQEAPILNIMGAAAKHVFLVTDPTKLEATIRTAFEVATTGRPGPVVIDIPKDVQNWEGRYLGEGKLPIPGYRRRMEAIYANTLAYDDINSFDQMLKASKRPLIYAGGGIIHAGASAELTEFAETLQIPVVTTLMGIGGIDTTHDLCLNMLGMHGTPYANYAVEDCDLLIAIGARFDDRVAGNVAAFAPNAKQIAHLDIDPSEIGKVKKVDWQYIGEIKAALSKLTQFSSGKYDYSEWLTHVRQLRTSYPMDYDRESDLIQPYQVIEEMNRITQGNAIISTGVGQHQMWAAQYSQFKEPRLWLTSGSMGTMGFGVPAAVGAQFACPDRTVINIDGDGSIRMNLGELETVTTYDLPIKILLINNLGDGMVRQWQKLYFGQRFAGSDKSLHKKNFIKAAEADGFEFAKRITQKDEITSALEAFIAFKGPALLEVMIDEDAGVYPMVGPGSSYAEMNTGEHMNSRCSSHDSGSCDIGDVKPPSLF